MTEWKKAWIGAVIGAIVMGGVGFVTTSLTKDNDTGIRFAKIETNLTAITDSLASLTKKTEDMASIQQLTALNSKNLDFLTIEVRELTKTVTRLATIVEISIDKKKN